MIARLFHAVDGQFECLSGNCCGCGGGVIVWTDIVVAMFIVEVVGEVEEALEVGFRVGVVAGDVRLEIEGW